MESKKAEIKTVFRDKLDWCSSRKTSISRRIIYKRECEIFDPEKEAELFAWMIDRFDEICNALAKVGELDNEEQPTKKFAGYKVASVDLIGKRIILEKQHNPDK